MKPLEKRVTSASFDGLCHNMSPDTPMSSGWADLIMVVYAVSANLPCILAQRYNRARIQRLLARRP